jgi:hypothetical protein
MDIETESAPPGIRTPSTPRWRAKSCRNCTLQGFGCAISKASALLLTKNTDTAPSCRAVVRDGVQRVDENDCSRARCISCRNWNAGFCVSIKPSSTVVAVVSALAKVLCRSVNRLSPSEERSPKQTPAVSPPGFASVGKLRCLGHKRLLPIRRSARRVPLTHGPCN